MNIRPATHHDARRISYLIQKSTKKNPNAYTLEQIRAWTKYNTVAKIKKQLEDRIFFVAFEKGKLLGCIALKDTEVLGFYVSYAIRGKGIGSKLLAHLEQYAYEKGIKKLHLTATPSAYPFYLSKGFYPVEQVEISIYGIVFPEMEMEKVLS
ncbi:MAG: GNAT family N-acetyltransferase [Bacteroidota bacterium]